MHMHVREVGRGKILTYMCTWKKKAGLLDYLSSLLSSVTAACRLCDNTVTAALSPVLSVERPSSALDEVSFGSVCARIAEALARASESSNVGLESSSSTGVDITAPILESCGRASIESALDSVFSGLEPLAAYVECSCCVDDTAEVSSCCVVLARTFITVASEVGDQGWPGLPVAWGTAVVLPLFLCAVDDTTEASSCCVVLTRTSIAVASEVGWPGLPVAWDTAVVLPLFLLQAVR